MRQSFMEAVCWTLVHSLWQGLIAALVAGAVILTTRKSAAVLRYNLLTADLVLFLLAAVGTCSYELRADGGATPVGVIVADGVQAVAGKLAMHARYAVGAPTMMERVGVFLNEHAGAVVMVWMACLLMQLVRMTGGLYKVHRLRRHRVFLPAEYWQDRMSVLMGRLGIEKKVVLLQSGSVTMPMTFGFLKPSILVPLGMLANLPADQVETILLHELAHIRRSDYLANLLLHIGEAIFFFNPAVRWVAWLIRQEREACCDDLVLAGSGDRDSYFEALIAFGQYAIGRRSMALPLGSGKSDLLWRIRRMLNQENKKLHLMEKTILSFGLMAVMAIGLVSMKGAGRPGAVRVSGRPAATRVPGGAVVDTVPAASGKRPESAVKAPVAMTMANTTTSGATPAAPVTTLAAPVGAHVSPMTTIAAPTAVRTAPLTAISAPEAVTVAPLTATTAPEAVTIPSASAIVTPTAATAALTARMAPMNSVKLPVHPWAITGTVSASAPVPAPPVVENDLTKGIITDLEAKGIIQGVEPLSFRLDKHGMTVNGVKVSEEVFAFFRDKYITNPRNRFSYSHEGGSTSSTVWVY